VQLQQLMNLFKCLIVFLFVTQLILIDGTFAKMESKVVIDPFSTPIQLSVQYPEDCDTYSFTIDNSILGEGRSLQDHSEAQRNFGYCPNSVSCSLETSMLNGEWTTSVTSNEVVGNCQMTAVYEGNYKDYGLFGAEGFRLSTDGATSFRIKATVTGAPVYVFIEIEGTTTLIELEVGTHDLIDEFSFASLSGSIYYEDFIYSLGLGVQFRSKASITISTFETYGPSNINTAYPIPPVLSAENIQTVFVLDDFSGTNRVSGSIPNPETCGFSRIDSSPDLEEDYPDYSDVVGRRIVSLGGCSESGDMDINEAGGTLALSASKGLAAKLSLSYILIDETLDFCAGNAYLIRYSALDEVPCSLFVATNDDDGDCKMSFVLSPDTNERVLALKDFPYGHSPGCSGIFEDINIRDISGALDCDIYGNSQSFKLNSIEYVCSHGNSCSCEQSSYDTDSAISPIPKTSSNSSNTGKLHASFVLLVLLLLHMF
jgi:hypothetical protein